MEKNENQFKEKGNKGVDEGKRSTNLFEGKSDEPLQPNIEKCRQAAALVMYGGQQLFIASQLDPRLRDCMVRAVSILQEGIRSLAMIDSEQKIDSKGRTISGFAEIIKEIIINLTGDREKDSKYLMEQIETYRHHEYGVEILRAIRRIVYGFLPEEYKNELSNILERDNLHIQVILGEAKSKLAEHDLEEAKNLILEILPREELFHSDEFLE